MVVSLVPSSLVPTRAPLAARGPSLGRGRGERLAVRAQGADKDDGKAPLANSVLSALCPLLKLVAPTDPTTPRNRNLEIAMSGFSSMARLPFGVKAGEAGLARAGQPKERIVVYEFEACPFCRRVREAVTDLDLEVVVMPCPKGAVRNRAELLAKGGKEMCPYMEDPNTGVSMYESGDIVAYLYENYGGGVEVPSYLLPSTLVSGWVPTLLRAGRGMTRWEGAKDAPAVPLELYNYDGNQFARLVREALCELELPFVVKSCGKGSPRREALRALSGKTQVPYLVDPNTGTSIGDSEKILEYLWATYTTPIDTAA